MENLAINQNIQYKLWTPMIDIGFWSTLAKVEVFFTIPEKA
jgi:hypothetical protein